MNAGNAKHDKRSDGSPFTCIFETQMRALTAALNFATQPRSATLRAGYLWRIMNRLPLGVWKFDAEHFSYGRGDLPYIDYAEIASFRHSLAQHHKAGAQFGMVSR